MSFIEVQNITKTYGKTQVIRGIDFQVDQGEQLVIQGSSGSGKSTLLYILGALETPTTGSIEIGGHDFSKMDDSLKASFRNQVIGFVFQFHFLLPSMNCIDNILLPAKMGKHPLKEVKERIFLLAKDLGVEHCLKKYPFELSGGEQQRINLIRALSLSPPLLLCDEPTGNLDSKNSELVITLLQELGIKFESTLIVVTHNDKMAKRFPRQIRIEDGQIIS